MVTATGEWDSDRLRDLLPSTVLEYMAATPLPLARLGDDVPGWRWDEKRQFQVSSAYAVLMEVGERRHASSWSKIWSLQVPQRGRYFVAPPVEVVGLVAAEQQRWEDRRMVGALGS
ncbi:hypothetical protein V6N13_072571 [Hibiscus sabdariffa]